MSKVLLIWATIFVLLIGGVFYFFNRPRPYILVNSLPLPTAVPQVDYKLDLPDYIKSYNPTSDTVQYQIESGPLLFSLRQFPLNTEDNYIFGLVPQNVSEPSSIYKTTVNQYPVTKTKYTSFDLKEFYQNKHQHTWSSYGYIIDLPSTRLFFFVDGYGRDAKSNFYNDVWFEKNILSKLSGN